MSFHMLTNEEINRIEQIVHQYEQRSAAVPEALRIVQDRCGWVNDEAVREIAELLEVSPEAVDDVATFYSLIYRRPVGRHVILLCDSVIVLGDGLPRRARPPVQTPGHRAGRNDAGRPVHAAAGRVPGRTASSRR